MEISLICCSEAFAKTEHVQAGLYLRMHVYAELCMFK